MLRRRHFLQINSSSPFVPSLERQINLSHEGHLTSIYFFLSQFSSGISIRLRSSMLCRRLPFNLHLMRSVSICRNCASLTAVWAFRTTRGVYSPNSPVSLFPSGKIKNTSDAPCQATSVLSEPGAVATGFFAASSAYQSSRSSNRFAWQSSTSASTS